MSIFGIFHNGHHGHHASSAAHTTATLESFFRFTSLRPDDEVMVIDNDGDFRATDPRIEVVHTAGATFAQNVNHVLWRALNKHTAAFCLRNDLLFTAGWRDALMEVGTSIAAPLHHHNITDLALGTLHIPEAFDLDFYRAHRAVIDSFAAAPTTPFSEQGAAKVWVPSFSCFRVSPEAIARLGPFDERFTESGAGADYALRAHLQKIDCLVCLSSFVFHLGGKAAVPTHSTDRPHPRQTFEVKWGAALSEHFVSEEFVGSEGIEKGRESIRMRLADAGVSQQPPVCGNATFRAIDGHNPGQMYLGLLKDSLSNLIYGDAGWLNAQEQTGFNPQLREVGGDWPMAAHTMIGLKRLDNLQFCLEDALNRGVPGDVVETGVWRGGATILMRGVLKAHGATDRKVWVADSFQGLPPANREKYPQDDIPFHEWRQLAISLEEVKSNFEKYDLLDSQVQFLKGWFRDTLASAPIERLAVARLDGDMYESTMDGLVHLYEKLSPGGYLIVDDYRNIPACRQAVTDFREQNGISDEIHFIDWGGVYWRKS